MAWRGTAGVPPFVTDATPSIAERQAREVVQNDILPLVRLGDLPRLVTYLATLMISLHLGSVYPVLRTRFLG